MKKLNTYALSIRRFTPIVEIEGSNCSTKHKVPDFLTAELAHALMNFVYGAKQLPQYVEHTRSRASERIYKDAFTLQALGLVQIQGAQVCIYNSTLPLIKRLKREGWYYWYGGDPQYLEVDLKRSNRLIEG